MDCYFGLPKIVVVLSGAGVLAEAADGVVGLPIFKEISGVLQFGAFGLCAMMMLGVWKLLEQHRRERAELVESLKVKEAENKQLAIASIQAMNKIAEALKDRKCVAGDNRIKVDE